MVFSAPCSVVYKNHCLLCGVNLHRGGLHLRSAPWCSAGERSNVIWNLGGLSLSCSGKNPPPPRTHELLGRVMGVLTQNRLSHSMSLRRDKMRGKVLSYPTKLSTETVNVPASQRKPGGENSAPKTHSKRFFTWGWWPGAGRGTHCAHPHTQPGFQKATIFSECVSSSIL